MDSQIRIDPPTGLSAPRSRRDCTDGYRVFIDRRRTIDIALSVREPCSSSDSPPSLLDPRRLRGVAFCHRYHGITIFQERRNGRWGLRDLSSPRALVIRDGEQKRIAGREVVRDDCLIITEGDRVPADAVLHSCNDLMVDESLLSGESVPVRKATWNGVQEVTRPGGDDLPFVFAGTMLVQGRGVARVIATGARTEMGHIGKALQSVETDHTYLQREAGNLIRNFAAVGLSVCALAVVLYGLTRGSWINGFLAGVALAMALLPEEIPVVLTVFLALGAWRMSQKRVLTGAWRPRSILRPFCADKTGADTNHMTVKRLCVGADS